MAESPKRPVDRFQAETSRQVKPSKPAGVTGETAKASDSIPLSVGPFTVLPTVFGRYRIEKLLGKGAMGAVYLAHDTQLDRPVALKVARVSAAGSAKLIKRMETEAKAAAKLDHPQICKVYDFGEIDGMRFIALQYIAGEDFKAYLKRVGVKREPDEAIGWIIRLAGALEVAHEKGIIHRDLKPENIMLDRKYEPVIMDFGLARNTTGATNAGLTQGMILGTAAYMSPEQAIGKAEGIDHRSDLYALGVMLFEMLTGEWPFTGSAIEVMGKKSVQEAPSPLSVNPNIPARLAAICQKLIAKKKEDRYLNCAEVIAALEEADRFLTAPVNKPVEFAAVPQLCDIPIEPPPPPHWHKSATASQSRRLHSPIKRGIETFLDWWRDQPPPFRWTIMGCSGVVVLLQAALLFFRTGDALVKVEVLNDDINVTFHDNTITVDDGHQQLRAKPGRHTLHIKSGDIEFDTESFTLRRGENPVVTVEIVDSDIVTKLGEKEFGRRSLTTSVSGESKVKANQEAVKPSLSELLSDGTVLTGQYWKQGNDEVLGDFTLTILKRDGPLIEGRYFKQDRINNDPGLTTSVEGKVTENTLEFNGIIKVSNVAFSATGSIESNLLQLAFSTASGGRFTMRAALPNDSHRSGAAITPTRFRPAAVSKESKWIGVINYPQRPEVTAESGLTFTQVDGDEFTAEYYWALPGDMRRLEVKGRFTAENRFILRPYSMLGGRWNTPNLLSEEWNGAINSQVMSLTRVFEGGEFPHTLTLQNEKRASDGIKNGNFENGFDGWERESGAENFAVFKSQPDGEMVMTTFGTKRETTTGRVFQSFVIPMDADSLCFSLSGGAGSQTYVSLKYDGKTHNRASARNDNTPHLVTWNVQSLRGKRVTLDMVDESTGAWGFIAIRGVKIITAPNRAEPATKTNDAESDKAGIARLKQALIGYSWNYVDSLYLPGGPVRFYPNGKFHDQWKWNYWVVGPRTMHVQFWDPSYAPEKSVVFTFNDDLTGFTAQFDNHKITGTRLQPVQ